jgi:hypothetical protein
MSKRKRRSAARFLQLHHRLLKSRAWHLLTPLQRCGYIEIAQLYDGTNNGRLAMSTRRLAGVIPCSKNSPILQELEDAGFIDTVRVGRYTRDKETRVASEYRLTDFRCDVTGDLPSRRYNERVRWEPSEPKPKRIALTDAERARRYRKRHAERPNEWDGSVPMNGAAPVTVPETPKFAPRKTAKNEVEQKESVTPTVPPNGTLIHLTRGEASLGGTPRGKTGDKTCLAPFAVGHENCKRPLINSLPPGWHWCRGEQRVVTNAGIVVPLVDDPLIGSEEQREALRFLEGWRARVVPFSKGAA